MTRHFPPILAAALLLAACDLMGAGAQPELDGTWQLDQGTHAGQEIPLVAAAPISLVVDGDSVGGVAACNHYGGEIDRGNGRFSIGAVTMTEMGCDPAIMTSESAYIAALAVVERASRAGDTLRLTGRDVELVFTIVPPVADHDLVGTTWLLDTLISGDSASSVLGDPATLELRDDGTFTGSTGCRSFDGLYELADGAVTVHQLANDDRACADELVRQDEHVLAALADGFAYEISGRRLTLSAGTLGLGYGLADG